ncbi:MAG TPA: TonB-dependent receptor [Candidatus Dormibacteraeota bacterium]|nr:TonB-dependent receptor [Candidatus Dormibacteraeota bacterium]
MTIRLLLLFCVAVTVVSAQSSSPPAAQNPPAPEKLPTVHQRIEVAATRLPEDPSEVPTAIEVFSGDELAARGVRDLRTALSVATGIEIAPGGDGGPASSVPGFWGLKEFDAFLLVVDGVPWGGAFNPALISLDLNDVERIEVLRGPAPVMYGATSFVGVLQIVHKDAASKDRTLTLRGGSFGTGGFAFSTPVPLAGRWASRLSLDAQREGFRDDRTAYRRGHGRWMIDRKGEDAKRTWFNFDLNWLDQDPSSPRPRQGAVLSPLVPVDSNHNPAGAFLNDHRFTATGGFDQRAGEGFWSTTASVSHSWQHAFRGFLLDIADAPNNAHGFRKNTNLTDVYLDSHFSRKLPSSVTLLVGTDYLHGTGTARGADFDYTAPLNGAQAVQVPVPGTLDVHIDDSRNFFGAYSSLEWHPLERVRLDGGLRVNVTHEGRADRDLGAGTNTSETRTDARVSASVGAIVTAWQSKQDSVGLYVNYRDTFKPAAIDFGIGESRGGALILQPETSRSVEGGIKGRFFERRVETEASGFLMNFHNLVTATSIGGVPALINAGKQRFQGFEAGGSVFLPNNFMARGTYSFHDAKFRDFMQDFGGVPTQLAGKRLEMSARHLAALAISYTPPRGVLAGFDVYYTGRRFLNRRNTALAEGFPDVGITAGYRARRWELRVDARNLGNRRDPVAESELGDAQYYLLPARRVDASFTAHF